MAIKLKQEDQSAINLTPLIDIVFLLIIFFMVGTRFTEIDESEKAISINVPQVSDGTALTAAPKKRVINVLHDGRIMLDREETSLKALLNELTLAKQQYAKLGVIVRGDAESQYQSVVRVIEACRNAEIVDLNIAVRTADRQTKSLR